MLQLGFGATAGLFTVGSGRKKYQPTDNCPVTPDQDPGPFYPIIQGEDEDVDLTMIKGHTERAAGKQSWCGAAFSTTNVTLFPMH